MLETFLTEEKACAEPPERTTVEDGDEKEAEATAKVQRAVSKKRKPVDPEEDSVPPPPPTEPTEYALNRPRRDMTQASTYRNASQSLALVPCCRFLGCAGSGLAQAQPFKVEMDPSVAVLMDLHAHMCSNEVIGLLGGHFDAASRTILVQKVFPGRGKASGRDVEMDPVAEVEMRAEIAAAEMKVVGWYHSHPVFEPNPSHVDIDNQINYQSLFRDSDSGLEPFIAFIIGPYDLRLPTQESRLQTFYVQNRAGAAEPTPLQIDYTTSKVPLDDEVAASACKLVDSQAKVERRVSPTEILSRMEDDGADL
eukprot:gene3703-4640_t